MNEKFSYQSETTMCRSKQNEVCDNSQSAKPITIHQLQLKKVSLEIHTQVHKYSNTCIPVLTISYVSKEALVY